MKIFLSALEQKGKSTFNYINDNVPSFKWNLMSYFYVRKTNKDIINKIIEKSELILIDSGAHSFQKGIVVDWVEYTKEYAKWIKENDCDKIIGYFEMDVDKVIGYGILHDFDLSNSYVIYSGRMPADMVIKMTRAGVPILASNAAPANSGYNIAKKGNITLVGFLRGQRCNIYNNQDRILF